MKAFHMLAKPIGPYCNMSCTYCFYSEKTVFYPNKEKMSLALLENYISSYISAQPGQTVSFLWQGGEPMLMGLSFYQTAVRLQKKYAGKRTIYNSIQTNGTLITPDWCRFFKQNNFLVGISLDGPEAYHDQFRKMKSSQPSQQRTLKGLQLLRQYNVDFNITCCVTSASSHAPLELYHYFKEIGAQYIQFAPIVERTSSAAPLHFSSPSTSPSSCPQMSPESVIPQEYGAFMTAIFDEWVRNDIGHIYVMNFEWALERWLGVPSSYCMFADHCGNALAMEHNGDIYACDHFVYPEFYLGNLTHTSMEELLANPTLKEFSTKKQALSSQCLDCHYRFACNGECPKNRFLLSADGSEPVNYLCAGYQLFFQHIDPYMRRMVELIHQGRQPYEIRYELEYKAATAPNP